MVEECRMTYRYLDFAVSLILSFIIQTSGVFPPFCYDILQLVRNYVFISMLLE